MDSYGADFSVLFVAVCECIAVMWVYGKSRLLSDSWEKNKKKTLRVRYTIKTGEGFYLKPETSKRS